MGKYLYLRFELSSLDAVADPLVRLLSHPHVRLVGFAGVESRKVGEWLLAGRGFEPFVSEHFKGVRSPASKVVSVAPTDAYIARWADWIKAKAVPSLALLLGESLDEVAQATVLSAEAIDAPTVRQIATWLWSNPGAFGDFYLTIPFFSLAGGGPSVCHDAFRFVVDCADPKFTIYIPFVILRVGSRPFEPEILNISIFSQSWIWLRGNGAPKHIGTAEADANLDTLVSIATGLFRDTKYPYTATLYCDSTRFVSEQDRILSQLSSKGIAVSAGNW